MMNANAGLKSLLPAAMVIALVGAVAGCATSSSLSGGAKPEKKK